MIDEQGFARHCRLRARYCTRMALACATDLRAYLADPFPLDGEEGRARDVWRVALYVMSYRETSGAYRKMEREALERARKDREREECAA